MYLTQKQWFAVFDYATATIFALVLAFIGHWLDFPWWYNALGQVWILGPWFRKDIK